MAEVIPGDRSARRPTRGRVADQIVDDLRERILSGSLPNGSRLPAERELAESYGVSGATVRESVRVLTAMGLISARHGSGSFVTADTSTMIALSVASVVRLENAGVADALGVLAALNRQAVQLAVQEATDAEIASYREAAEQLAVIDDVPRTAEALRVFLRRPSELSRNPLLAALCRLFADLQVELALETSGGALANWQRVVGVLQPERLAIVEAVERRSAEDAADLVTAYTERAQQIILSTPHAYEISASDPGYSRLLSELLNTRIAAAMH
jgi:GntR family transcriptional repressor for pyruvate dehydrogenase complex